MKHMNFSHLTQTAAVAAMLVFSPLTPVAAMDTTASVDLPVIAASERGSPRELLALLGKFIAARDVDSIMAIHEPNAALVEWGGAIARGPEEIRQVYVDFFATEPDLKVQALQVIEADGVAIILGDYTLDYVNTNQKVVSVGGKFGDMVRQQPDGSWLYLLDNPYAP